MKEDYRMNKKSTKRSLLFSVLALILCCSLLAGTTLAWFTDTASSGVNKIVAGNLDVEVEYKTNDPSSQWKTIENDNTLFSVDLWEPGHTEFVYLRVKNAGSLGLKYKVLVTPVSENGGINVNNQNFKLSNYLVFGTTTPTTSFAAFADREAARTAVGTARGLNQEDMQKSGEIKAGEAEQYLALVVYMPESVGNDANAKPGTTAPSIELGIKVVATQLEAEFDSIDNTYDSGAVNDPVYVAGSYYDYFDAVNVTTTSTAAEGTGTGVFTVQKVSGTGGSTIIASASGVTESVGTEVNLLVMKSSDAENNFTVTVEDGHELNGYDIKVTGQKENTLVQAKLYVGTGLENFKFYHNSALMTFKEMGDLGEGEYRYNPDDGYVYFATSTFSPFQATYKAPVAAIGTAVYGTVQDAIMAAPEGAPSATVITILKDVTGGASFGFPDSTADAGRNVTIDFAGHSYEFQKPAMGSLGYESQAMHLIYGNTMTLKNGTVSVAKSDTAVKRMIQNYCDLTLENMTVDCTNVTDSYNNSICRGSLTVKGKTNLIASSATAKIFDVDGAYCDSNNCDVRVVFDDTYTGTTSGVIEYVASTGTRASKLEIKAGTFTGSITSSGSTTPTITGGKFAANPSAFVADGYEVPFKDDGYYHIEKIEYWKDHAAASYATPVDNTNKIVTIASAEELALFGNQVSSTTNYSRYTVNITENIDLGRYKWQPINGWNRMSGITFNGNDHTISNMIVKNNFKGETGGFGVGFVGNTNGAITWNNLTFDKADVSFDSDNAYSGNVGGVVMGYTYGTTVFNNVSVTNSTIYGYGKIGALLGMGADPGVKVTFENCTSKDNTIAAVYDMGGLAGLIQRNNGADNTTIKNCTVENINLKTSQWEEYVDLNNVQATFKSNDKSAGADTPKSITGKYWVSSGYYWGGYADYYVSYGNSEYDAPITTGEHTGKCIANSEICININK